MHFFQLTLKYSIRFRTLKSREYNVTSKKSVKNVFGNRITAIHILCVSDLYVAEELSCLMVDMATCFLVFLKLGNHIFRVLSRLQQKRTNITTP